MEIKETRLDGRATFEREGSPSLPLSARGHHPYTYWGERRFNLRVPPLHAEQTPPETGERFFEALNRGGKG